MCIIRNNVFATLVFCLAIIFPASGICGQDEQANIGGKNKFDLKTFNKNRKKKTTYTFSTLNAQGDSVRITYVDDVGFYAEYIEKLGTPFVIQKKYDKRTLNLIKKNQTFYKNNFGYTYTYDIFGNLLEKKNEDECFDFSLNQLRELILQQCNLDIFVKNELEEHNPIIQRAVNPSVYYVKLPLSNFKNKPVVVNGIRSDLFEIDGNSGQILESPNQARIVKNEMIEILNDNKNNKQ